MVRFGGGRLIMVLMISAVLLLASCGGGGDDDDTVGAPNPAAESPADDAPEEEDCLGPAPVPSKNIKLTTSGMAFKPATLKARAGELVRISYTNEDSLPHTFTVEAIGCDSNTVAADDSVELTFEMPDGTTEFVCTIHPSMTGRLVAT